ncbi:uncharacterized protein METZ01_LOCUS445115, partial [marine metagenome]
GTDDKYRSNHARCCCLGAYRFSGKTRQNKTSL